MAQPTHQETKPGVLAAEDLRAALADGIISLQGAVGQRQIQPASIDLTVGDVAFRVRAAFLPGTDNTVGSQLERGMALHRLDLTRGAVLEKGCVYLVPLREGLKLPPGWQARANPKSSTGRIDVFVRLVTDYGDVYDTVPLNYEGRLYAEISPRTFSVIVREGSSLNQLRIRTGDASLDDATIAGLHAEDALVSDPSGTLPCRIKGGLNLSVDLTPTDNGMIGYRARRHTGLIDVDQVGALDAVDYWEALPPPSSGWLTLDPDEFYILRSAEELRIPLNLAAEMVPIDTDLGAFRVHYAGFFDPGFGLEAGSRAVLEVRGYDAPFAVAHGQVLARLVYERLTRTPASAYGSGVASNYQGQSLRLSKHFAI